MWHASKIGMSSGENEQKSHNGSQQSDWNSYTRKLDISGGGSGENIDSTLRQPERNDPRSQAKKEDISSGESGSTFGKDLQESSGVSLGSQSSSPGFSGRGRGNQLDNSRPHRPVSYANKGYISRGGSGSKFDNKRQKAGWNDMGSSSEKLDISGEGSDEDLDNRLRQNNLVHYGSKAGFPSRGSGSKFDNKRQKAGWNDMGSSSEKLDISGEGSGEDLDNRLRQNNLVHYASKAGFPSRISGSKFVKELPKPLDNIRSHTRNLGMGSSSEKLDIFGEGSGENHDKIVPRPDGNVSYSSEVDISREGNGWTFDNGRQQADWDDMSSHDVRGVSGEGSAFDYTNVSQESSRKWEKPKVTKRNKSKESFVSRGILRNDDFPSKIQQTSITKNNRQESTTENETVSWHKDKGIGLQEHMLLSGDSVYDDFEGNKGGRSHFYRLSKTKHVLLHNDKSSVRSKAARQSQLVYKPRVPFEEHYNGSGILNSSKTSSDNLKEKLSISKLWRKLDDRSRVVDSSESDVNGTEKMDHDQLANENETKTPLGETTEGSAFFPEMNHVYSKKASRNSSFHIGDASSLEVNDALFSGDNKPHEIEYDGGSSTSYYLHKENHKLLDDDGLNSNSEGTNPKISSQKQFHPSHPSHPRIHSDILWSLLSSGIPYDHLHSSKYKEDNSHDKDSEDLKTTALASSDDDDDDDDDDEEVLSPKGNLSADSKNPTVIDKKKQLHKDEKNNEMLYSNTSDSNSNSTTAEESSSGRNAQANATEVYSGEKASGSFFLLRKRNGRSRKRESSAVEDDGDAVYTSGNRTEVLDRTLGNGNSSLNQNGILNMTEPELKSIKSWHFNQLNSKHTSDHQEFSGEGELYKAPWENIEESYPVMLSGENSADVSSTGLEMYDTFKDLSASRSKNEEDRESAS